MKTIASTILMTSALALMAGAHAAAQEAELVDDVLIVTAQKRAQNIMDVPLSLSAISAEDISRRGFVSAEDYLRGMPGVNQLSQDEGYGGQTIIIRGLDTAGGSGSQNFGGSGSNVATFFGETPLTGSGGTLGSSIDLKLFDIERVEVLRGPQGTAFGSSSMSGAVRVIPAAPDVEAFKGGVGAEYSVTGREGGGNYEAHGFLNIPLVEGKLAVRAVAYGLDRSGFYKNTAGSDPAFIAAVAAPFGAEAFATDADDVGASKIYGGRISALWKPTDRLDLTLTYARQETEANGVAWANSGRYEQKLLEVAPEHRVRGQRHGANDTRIDLFNATLTYDLDWAELLATYSYIDSSNTFSNDCLSSGLPYACSTGGRVDHSAHSGEIRVATSFDGPINILAGVYGEKNKDDYAYSFLWYGDPATNFFGGNPIFDYFDKRDLSQVAAFGEVSWTIVPDLTLTGGARVYKYDRDTDITQGGAVIGPDPISEVVKADKSGSTFRANLSYKISEDTLLYAGWSQGFRLGKPQTGVPAQVCDLDSDGLIDGTDIPVNATRNVNSDSVDSYEVGGKFSSADRKLSLTVAAFRMDWKDIPVSVQYPSCAYVTTANAGKARSEGFEVQANIALTDNFRVDIGGSWVDARLTRDVPTQGFLDGDRLPGGPKFNASIGIQGDLEVAGRPLSLRVDGMYLGEFYSALPVSPAQRAGDYVQIDTSARLGLGNLNLDLFVRNLTNEDAFVNRAGAIDALYGSRMRPRTIGVRVNYGF